MKEALAFNNASHFEYYRDWSPSFWRKNPEARRIITQYLENKYKTTTIDQYRWYGMFECKVFNGQPEAHYLIQSYINKSPFLPDYERYHNEPGLCMVLIQMNREKEAIVLMESMIRDYLKVQGSFQWLGDLHGRKNPLERHCFSTDASIRKKARELLFHFLEKERATYHDLITLGTYLDEKEMLRISKLRLEHYRQFDFKDIKLAEMESGNGWMNRTTIQKEVLFFSHFFFNETQLLAKNNAREIWNWNQRHIQFFKNCFDEKSFIENQLLLLKYCMADSSLQKEEKISMLIEMDKPEAFFTAVMYEQERFRYVGLVHHILSNPQDEQKWKESLGLHKMDMAIIRKEDFMSAKVTYNQAAMTQEFTRAGFHLPTWIRNPSLGDHFQLKPYTSPSDFLVFLFRQTGRMFSFDAFNTKNARELIRYFNLTIKPVLASAGIRDMEIAIGEGKTDDGVETYTLHLRSGAQSWKITEPQSSWNIPNSFFKRSTWP